MCSTSMLPAAVCLPVSRSMSQSVCLWIRLPRCHPAVVFRTRTLLRSCRSSSGARAASCCGDHPWVVRWLLGKNKPNQAPHSVLVPGKKRPSAEKCLLSARNRSRPESRAEPEPRRTRRRPGSCSRRPCSSSWTHPRRSTWSGESGSSGKYR